ncbi:7288_t:CDS:1, partial [Gigaspora rosea]
MERTRIHMNKELENQLVMDETESENPDEEEEIKILRPIKDIKMRWNSSYLAWKRLLILKPAIEWLYGTIGLLNEPDARKDVQELNKR